MPKLTLLELWTIVGDPIVLVQVFDPVLKRVVELHATDLGPQALQTIIDFYESHLGNR